MRTYESEQILNVGCGEDVTIRELAELIAQVVGFQGHLTFDASKPDGAPRKLLDVGRLASLGWSPGISLADGVRSTYDWFVANERRVRR